MNCLTILPKGAKSFDVLGFLFFIYFILLRGAFVYVGSIRAKTFANLRIIEALVLMTPV